MQVELVNTRRWKTRVELANAIFDYIEIWPPTSPPQPARDAFSDRVRTQSIDHRGTRIQHLDSTEPGAGHSQPNRSLHTVYARLMTSADGLFVVGGLVVLVGGGELLVREGPGSRGTCRPLLTGHRTHRVGLLHVVPGTGRHPRRGSRGQPDLAVGNVVGSNIVNVLLILGTSALLLPLTVRTQLIRLDVPVMVAASLGLLLLSLDGRLGFGDGLLLVAGIVAYITVSMVVGRRSSPDDRESTGRCGCCSRRSPGGGAAGGRRAAAGRGCRGHCGGVRGERSGDRADGRRRGYLASGAGDLAHRGPTRSDAVSATWRSATSSAARFSTSPPSWVIAAALVADDGVPVAEAVVALDIPLMVATAIALLPVAFTGMAIARWEGALFLGLYAAFTAYVLLADTEHDALGGFHGRDGLVHLAVGRDHLDRPCVLRGWSAPGGRRAAGAVVRLRMSDDRYNLRRPACCSLLAP